MNTQENCNRPDGHLHRLVRPVWILGISDNDGFWGQHRVEAASENEAHGIALEDMQGAEIDMKTIQIVTVHEPNDGDQAPSVTGTSKTGKGI